MYPERTPTRGGRVSLSAARGYRGESGRNRQRAYETFGFVDELEGEFDDPVAHLRKVVAATGAERRAREAPATTGAHPPGRVDKRASGRPGRHVGDALACWWLDALGVEAAIRNATRGRRVGYDPDATPGLLVCERLVDPGPELAAHPDRDRHFFRSELTDDDAYRAPAELDRVSGRIVGARDRAIARNAGRDESLVYYDVTNYFFECDPDEGGGRGGRGCRRSTGPAPSRGWGCRGTRGACPSPTTSSRATRATARRCCRCWGGGGSAAWAGSSWSPTGARTARAT